jgi:hypothetical protein
MQHSWWLPVRDFAQHVLTYSVALMLFTLAAVAESNLTMNAERLIESKFVFHLLVCLGYAVAVSDAIFILMLLVEDIQRKLKRGKR